MRVKDLSKKNETSINWEDLEPGCVALFADGTLEFLGMKVEILDEGFGVLDLDENIVYDDAEEYKILKVFKNAELVYNSGD